MKLPYRKRYYLQRPDLFVKHVYREIKWFIQRGRRGYSDADIWSLDYWLLTILPPAIRSLADTYHGHPVGLCRSDCMGMNDTCHCEEKWIATLNQMAEGLEKGILMQEAWDFSQEHKNEFDDAFGLFHKHFFSLWD